MTKTRKLKWLYRHVHFTLPELRLTHTQHTCANYHDPCAHALSIIIVINHYSPSLLTSILFTANKQQTHNPLHDFSITLPNCLVFVATPCTTYFTHHTNACVHWHVYICTLTNHYFVRWNGSLLCKVVATLLRFLHVNHRLQTMASYTRGTGVQIHIKGPWGHQNLYQYSSQITHSFLIL